MTHFVSIGVDPGSRPTICVIRNWARLPEDVWFYEEEQTATRRGLGNQKSHHFVPCAEAIEKIFSYHKPGLILIEEVWPREGWAIQNSMRFVGSMELCRGIATGLGIPSRRLRPQQWQKRVRKQKGKDGSRATAMDLRPDLSPWFTRKKDHNRADAFLLAWCAHGILQRAWDSGKTVRGETISKHNARPPEV